MGVGGRPEIPPRTMDANDEVAVHGEVGGAACLTRMLPGPTVVRSFEWVAIFPPPTFHATLHPVVPVFAGRFGKKAGSAVASSGTSSFRTARLPLPAAPPSPIAFHLLGLEPLVGRREIDHRAVPEGPAAHPGVRGLLRVVRKARRAREDDPAVRPVVDEQGTRKEPVHRPRSGHPVPVEHPPRPRRLRVGMARHRADRRLVALRDTFSRKTFLCSDLLHTLTSIVSRIPSAFACLGHFAQRRPFVPAQTVYAVMSYEAGKSDAAGRRPGIVP